MEIYTQSTNKNNPDIRKLAEICDGFKEYINPKKTAVITVGITRMVFLKHISILNLYKLNMFFNTDYLPSFII